MRSLRHTPMHVALMPCTTFIAKNGAGILRMVGFAVRDNSGRMPETPDASETVA